MCSLTKSFRPREGEVNWNFYHKSLEWLSVRISSFRPREGEVNWNYACIAIKVDQNITSFRPREGEVNWNSDCITAAELLARFRPREGEVNWNPVPVEALLAESLR